LHPQIQAEVSVYADFLCKNRQIFAIFVKKSAGFKFRTSHRPTLAVIKKQRNSKMEKFESFEIQLKNGKSVRIRQAKIADAEKAYKYSKKYIRQSEFIPKLGSEFIITIEQEKEWVDYFLKNGNSLLLGAGY